MNGTELVPQLQIAVYKKVKQAVIARAMEDAKQKARAETEVVIGGNFDGNFNSTLTRLFERMVQNVLVNLVSS